MPSAAFCQPSGKVLVLLLSEVLEPGVQELEDTHLLFALLLAFTERTLKVYLEPALTQLEKS
jgi:hypothetical protein